MSERRIKPWMVAAALAVIGAVGAVVVYAIGSRIHEGDRRAIVTWIAGARPSLTAIEQSIDEIKELGGRASGSQFARDVSRIRSKVEDAKFAIEHVRVEAVMEAVAGAYLNASVEVLEALSAIHEASFASDDASKQKLRARYRSKIDAAARHWRAADAALDNLRARYDVGL